MGKSTNQLIMEIYQRVNDSEVKKSLEEIKKYDKESEKILSHAEEVAAKLSKTIAYNNRNMLNQNFKSGNPFLDKLQKNAVFEPNQSPNITLMAKRLKVGFGKDNKEITELNKQLSSTAETFVDFRDAINDAGEFVKKTFSSADFFKMYEAKQPKPLFVGAEENARLEKEKQTAEKRITEALEKEAEVAEKLTKEKQKDLTAWQKEKSRLSEERNVNSAERNRIASQESARKQRESDDLANFRAYKNAHPEEFGSIRRSKRYQIGQLITGIADQFADRGLLGRGLGTASQIAQGALYGGMFGAATVGLTKLASGISELTKAADESYSTIESLKTQLSVVFGGYTQSAQMYTQIADYATHSPFGIEQTTELATLLRQSGVEATKVMETLRMLGDTATGDMEKMKRIANNYAQIVSIGKASMLDMRQFAYAGIPIFEAVSKELGVSQTKLRKMVSEGKVTAEIVEKVFKDMTGINGIFENATEKGAKTLKARKQNLQDIKSLALAGIGEEFANMGSRYGGDSLKMRHLEFSESFYEKIANQETFVNILRSVQNIEAGRDDILGIEQRITALEKKSLSGELEQKELKELEQLKADRDRIRQTLSDRDAVRANEASLYELYKGVDSNEIAKGLLWKEFLAGLVQSSYWILHQMTPTWLSKTLADRMNITAKGLGDTKDRYAAEYDFLKDLDIQKYFGSYAEQVVKKTQTANSDVVTGKRKESASYANAAQELLTKYEETEKYKKEEQQKQEERLKKVYNELVEIKHKLTKPNGALNFNQVSYKMFKELEEKGAIENSRKLATTFDDKNQAVKDFYTLFPQVQERTSEVVSSIGMSPSESSVPELYNDILAFRDLFASDNMRKIVQSNSFEQFYKNFNNLYGTLSDKAWEIINNKDADKVKRDAAKNILDTISNAFAEWQTIDISDNLDINSLFDDKGKNAFQPLWKRILGGALGFSPTAVTGTASALDFYQNNIQPRKRAASVMTTALKTGELDFDRIQRMLANPASLNNYKEYTTASEVRQGGKVWQIDWVAVDKEIKKFALSLKSSTEVINAYKSSLDEERDTLLNLLGSSISTFESEGTKSRIINAKGIKDGKFILSEDDAGINAFGEELKNVSGETVAAIKDGIAYGKDEDGKLYILEDQLLVLTGNIYEELKKRYEEKDKEAKEAAVTAAQKNILDNEMNNALNGRLIYGLEKGKSYEDFQFIERNSDKIGELFKATVESKGYNYSDLMKSYAQGDSISVSVVTAIMKTVWSTIASMSPEELAGYAESQKENALDNLKKGLRTKFDEEFEKITLFDEGKSDFVKNGDGTVNGAVSAIERDTRNSFAERSVLKSLGWAKNTDFNTIAEEKGISTDEVKRMFVSEFLVKELDKVRDSFEELTKDIGTKAWLAPFETLGEDMIGIVNNTQTWDDYMKHVGQSAQNITGDLVKNTGEILKQAGFSIATSSAMEHNWLGVAGGLTLAAAGGFAIGLGNSLVNYKNEETDEQKREKLQSITDQIKELLAQARADANYYETTLRHKKALSENQMFAQSVNDAIITPSGKVISTHPEDYLIATKTPENLGGGAPKITFNFIDKSSGVKVTSQRSDYNEATGTYDIEVVIENKVKEVIATSKGDEAFAVREARQNGKMVVA